MKTTTTTTYASDSCDMNPSDTSNTALSPRHQEQERNTLPKEMIFAGKEDEDTRNPCEEEIEISTEIWKESTLPSTQRSSISVTPTKTHFDLYHKTTCHSVSNFAGNGKDSPSSLCLLRTNKRGLDLIEFSRMLFGHFLIFYCIGSRNTIRVSINL
jgi:hypothetical protein